MKTETEVRVMLGRFDNLFEEDPTDETTETITVALLWVLDVSNQLEQYLPKTC